MRTFLVCAGLVLTRPTIVTAQQRAAPDLILSIYGGVSAGYPLWTLERQPMRGDGAQAPDTVRLSRNVNSSLTAGVLGTLFTSTHFGFSIEAAFRTFSFDDSCTPAVPFQPDSDINGYRNDRACNNISASGASGSVLAVTAGSIFRLGSRSALNPYFRGALSYSYTTLSSVAMAQPGDLLGDVTPLLIGDHSPRRGSIGLLAAGGFMLPLGPGYQFRLEVRDHLNSLKVVDGNADASGTAPTRVRVFHHLGLVMGLDIVLEQKRGRRY